MGLYDNWLANNPGQSDKQISNVEFVLKTIDNTFGVSLTHAQIVAKINSSALNSGPEIPDYRFSNCL